MKTGYDPRLRANLTVQDYHERYGAKLDGKGMPRTRPHMLCPACSTPLHTVGESGALVDATWAHNPSPAIGCPIKDSGAEKYALLRPVYKNDAAAEELRRRFFKNWELHWSFARSFAELANIEAFSGFIRHADKMSLWSYMTLNEWQLPYTFLATCEFPPPKGKAAGRRTQWLRFRFDSKLRTIEDLWIRVIPELKFLRLNYRTPHVGEPTSRHYIDCSVYVPDENWMATHTPIPPHPYAVRHMRKSFPAELGVHPV